MRDTELNILQALPHDANALTKVAFQAKKHWPYPDAYFKIWKTELTLTEAYIQDQIVYKVIYNENILGFYSIVYNKQDFFSGDVFVQEGFWLDHIFVLPEFHNMGIGRRLIKHAMLLSKKKDIQKLRIFVDPYAQGFYEKIGAICINFSKSSIPNRQIPVYCLKINTDKTNFIS